MVWEQFTRKHFQELGFQASALSPRNAARGLWVKLSWRVIEEDLCKLVKAAGKHRGCFFDTGCRSTMQNTSSFSPSAVPHIPLALRAEHEKTSLIQINPPYSQNIASRQKSRIT